MKRYLILFFLSVSFLISGVELEKESWNIEWGELIGDNLSLSNQLLLTSIPTYFIENMDTEHKHFTTEKERGLVFDHLKKIKYRELQLTLSDLLETKSNLIFNSYSDSKVTESDKKIDDNRSSLLDLQNITLDGDNFPNNFEIKYFPSADDSLSSKKEFEIKNYIKRESLDYYVSGTIEEEFNNLFVKIKLYSSYEDEPKVIWSGIGNSEEILNYRAEMLKALNKVIISEEILSYSVKSKLPDALIYVNKSFKGLGNFNGHTINSENLEIDILKEGYESLNIERIVSTDNFEILVELNPIQNKIITIETIPTGAASYYGSKFIGYTPVEVPIFSYAQKLSLSYEGYMERSLIIDNTSMDQSIILKKGIIDREENFIKEKDNFYIATGVFSIALGIPLYLNAVDGTINDNIYNIAIGNAIFWGVNLFYRLYSYLRAAEISVE